MQQNHQYAWIKEGTQETVYREWRERTDGMSRRVTTRKMKQQSKFVSRWQKET